jgi:hypothetical protein
LLEPADMNIEVSAVAGLQRPQIRRLIRGGQRFVANDRREISHDVHVIAGPKLANQLDNVEPHVPAAEARLHAVVEVEPINVGNDSGHW